MKIQVRQLILIVGLCILAACSSVPNRAPVIERVLEPAANPTEPVSVEVPSAKPNAEPRPTYTVKRGDTLLKIALDYGQSYLDLVKWNSLKNPDDIKVDQVLFVAGPDGFSGAKTSAVTGQTGVEVRNLTPINPATNKSSPKGDKRVYSEANLAELQKQDSAFAPLPSVKPESSASKPADKSSAPSLEQIEWMWPTDGKIITTFDELKTKGIDIAGKSGQDVVAVAAGKVIYVGNAMHGYGNILIVKHANNFLSAYGHNKVNLAKEGQAVAKGQKIAEMGNTESDVVKLHLEIRQLGKPVDPIKILPSR